ncbi:AraC family transcriptional regulator [Parabacteroides bouchesdurhonensis]|uniref:AraC family transcriptional regulator n=1 Tax=Parabacteroides bouchesdurhonensis TaxID=1936995 RepID=UPI000C83E64B|nr:AraC family transcriptional regulator [Parabacteroides bouchesdurhonensis]
MDRAMDVLKELTPLSDEDCFLVMQRPKHGFNYPLHIHPEFELNYLENASGAIRIVDDSIEEMDDLDLVLIAGNTKHAYSTHKCLCNNIFEITIQFHHSLFDSLINKRHFQTMKNMFAKASQGLVFSKDMIIRIQPELKNLSNDEKPDSFHNLLRLIEILKILSLDNKARPLNAANKISNYKSNDSDRLGCLMLYLHENYQQQILLSDAASLINMSEASLNRFLKKWTGKTFVDNLNDIRIAEAVCRLIDTSDSISEICYKCGFNNLSNFNRLFKNRKGNTPTEYREKYARTRFRI